MPHALDETRQALDQALKEIEALKHRAEVAEAENQRLKSLLANYMPVPITSSMPEPFSEKVEEQPISVRTLLGLRQEVTRLRDGAIRDWILHAYDLSAPI